MTREPLDLMREAVQTETIPALKIELAECLHAMNKAKVPKLEDQNTALRNHLNTLNRSIELANVPPFIIAEKTAFSNRIDENNYLNALLTGYAGIGHTAQLCELPKDHEERTETIRQINAQYATCGRGDTYQSVDGEVRTQFIRDASRTAIPYNPDGTHWREDPGENLHQAVTPGANAVFKQGASGSDDPPYVATRDDDPAREPTSKAAARHLAGVQSDHSPNKAHEGSDIA